MIAVGRASIETTHPAPGLVEQDPEDWWRSVVQAASACRASAAPADWAAVSVIAFTGARETFAMVDGDGRGIGRAIVWSDRRAVMQVAAMLAELGGRDAARSQTGVIFDAGTMAAKVRWLAEHDRDRLDAARWLLSPRDFVVARLTGDVVTDWTMASRSGLVDLHGGIAPDFVPDWIASRLPPITRPVSVVGDAVRGAEELGVPGRAAVVIGAGDRPCEVLGSGADSMRPMVSWGTTVNVSSPVDALPEPIPDGASISRSALGGFLVECGLSAGGSATGWLAGLTGVDEETLAALARTVPPGARGVVALPWLNGARAPWWREGATATFLGLRPDHEPADLARAIYEAVALDVARALELQSARRIGLAAAGGGAANDLWVDVLAAVTTLPVERRAHAELAASVGAALLGGYATGTAASLDHLNPVTAVVEPDPEWAARYEELRPAFDEAAARSLPEPASAAERDG
jgi:xylulokinase